MSRAGVLAATVLGLLAFGAFRPGRGMRFFLPQRGPRTSAYAPCRARC